MSISPPQHVLQRGLPQDYGKSLSREGWKVKKVWERHRKIGDRRGQFDVRFWHSQGDKAIFDAALEMVMDYLCLRHGHIDEPRLQRTVESFHKI